MSRHVAADAVRRARGHARDMSGSDDGDAVIVGMLAEAVMESVVLGLAVTATAFVIG